MTQQRRVVMKKLYKRKWLGTTNSEAGEGAEFLLYEIDATSKYIYGSAIVSDGYKGVSLSFDLDSVKGRKEAMKKLDVLVESFEEMKKYIADLDEERSDK